MSVASGAASGAATGAAGGPAGALLGAGIGAATGIGSALIGKHSNNNALKAQTASTDKALAVEQENEAYRRSEAKRIEDLQRAQFMAEQARLEPYRQAKQAFLNQQLSGRGLNIPNAVAPPAQFVPGQQQTQPQGRTLSSLASSMPYAQQNQQILQPLTLDDIQNWGSQYGQGA